MKEFISSTLLLAYCMCSVAQSPGGIGTTNLTAWFNPDNLVPGFVTNWPSTYPSNASTLNLIDTVAPYPSATNQPTNHISNYNNTISFKGNSTTAPMALQLLGTYNFLDNNLSTSQGTLFAVYYTEDLNIAQHVVDYRESGGDAIQLRGLSTTTSRIAIGSGSTSTNCTRDYTENTRPMLFSYSGNRSTSSSMKCRIRSLDWSNNPVASSASTAAKLGLTVGARNNTNGNYLGVNQSYISEIIFFNTDLSLNDNIRVESYLGIKYGITLDPTATSAGKYASSLGTYVWDASLTPSYHNDVIGIARDDISLLNQKQSHSFDDSTRLYLSSLALSNIDNIGLFSNDIAFLMVGHNGGLNEETASATAEIPSGQNIISRIEREWRVSNTNMNESYSFDFTLKSLTNLTTNPSELCILVDDDGDFTNATVYQAGLTFSINTTEITVSGINTIHIPVNSTKYITLATINNTAPQANLNLSTFLQGYYIGSSSMQSVLLNQGVSGAVSTETDDIDVSLMNATSPYAMAYTFTGTLQTDGTILCTFPAAAIGNSYYIKVNHRNTIETWSALPVTISSSTSYNFTSASTQAYGSNTIEVETGVWASYTGDENQDGFIDIFDFLDWDTDNQNFISGYYATDFNGDGFIDIFDFLIWDPNNQNFVGIITP
ncbi:MAG: hypothetical protein R2831_11675 [Chitinophagaceae bacterium]